MIEYLGMVLALNAVIPAAMQSDNLPNNRRICSEVIKVSIADLKIGEEKQIEWCSYGVRIVRRSEETVRELKNGGNWVQDEFSKNTAKPPQMKCDNCLSSDGFTRTYHRSKDPRYFVSLNHSPYMGCYISYFPRGAKQVWPNGKPVPLGPKWQGGYFDPCHELQFDEAGRALKGKRESQNLFIPPYEVESNGTITIGTRRK